jgi:hypothetical protein
LQHRNSLNAEIVVIVSENAKIEKDRGGFASAFFVLAYDGNYLRLNVIFELLPSVA